MNTYRYNCLVENENKKYILKAYCVLLQDRYKFVFNISQVDKFYYFDFLIQENEEECNKLVLYLDVYIEYLSKL